MAVRLPQVHFKCQGNNLRQRACNSLNKSGVVCFNTCKFPLMKLYHWTLNAKKILENGFHNRSGRIWFTDQLMGPLEGVHKNMRVLTIEVSQKDIEKYEESNKGTGYRVFTIPAEIVNEYKISNPMTYRDRGIYKINE